MLEVSTKNLMYYWHITLYIVIGTWKCKLVKWVQNSSYFSKSAKFLSFNDRKFNLSKRRSLTLHFPLFLTSRIPVYLGGWGVDNKIIVASYNLFGVV
jgi:hypothetical protein